MAVYYNSIITECAHYESNDYTILPTVLITTVVMSVYYRMCSSQE